jgi:ubiquitin-protein ligase
MICLDILAIRREWSTSSNMTDVIKAVVNAIDNPDTNRPLDIGQFF